MRFTATVAEHTRYWLQMLLLTIYERHYNLDLDTDMILRRVLMAR